MNVFELFATLSLDTSEYTKGLNDAEEQGDKFSGSLGRTSSKASIFGDVLKANLVSAAVQKGMGILINGMKKIGSAIEANIGTAVSRLDTLNSYSKTMEALGFTADEANEAQSRLTEAIDGLPTTLDGIISWQQQFTALSDDIQGSTDLTIALNNATLAAGKGQEAANNAMANWYGIISAGAPDAQHWQSLYSTMPAQMNQLAEATLGAGAKSDDLFQAWKNGIVTTEDVTNALISLNSEGINGVASFADQAQIGAQTIETAYGNINTAIGRNIANVLDVINGDTTEGGGRIVELLINIKGLINDIGSAVSSFVSEHEPQIAAIMDAVNSILNGGDLTSNLETIKSNATSIISDLTNLLVESLPEVANFATGIVEVLGKALIENAPALIESLIAIITNLVNWLAQPDMLSMLTDGAVTIITTLADGISTALPVILPAVMTIISTLVTTLSSPENVELLMQSALTLLGAIVMAIGQSLPIYIQEVFGFITNVQGLFSDAISWVSENVIAPLAEFALRIIEGIVEFGASIIEGVGEFGSKIFEGIDYITGGIFGDVLLFISDILSYIANFFLDIWNSLQGLVSQLLSGIGTFIGSALSIVGRFINSIRSFLAQIIGVIIRSVANAISTIISRVANFFTHILTSIHNGMSRARETVSNVLTAIKNKFTSIFDTVKSVVQGAIDYIKGLFDFEWSLPQIKLPHFTITGSLDLMASPPKVPSVGVSWYRKAMDEPYLLNGATIFGAAGGKLLGGGESGSEMIVGTNKLMNMMREAMGMENRPITINVYGAEGQDVRSLAKEVSRELEYLMRDKEAAYGL